MSPSHSSANTRKPLFDAIRRLIGRGFRQSEVDVIDDALDNAMLSDGSKGLETRAGGQSRFSALDNVSSVSGVPRIRSTKRNLGVPTAIGTEGIALIKAFEGCARLRRDGLVEAYPDPGTGAEPWTIGWGATGLDDQSGDGGRARIGPGTVWTQAQCDARLASDLTKYAADVTRALNGAPTTQEQFDAMVSFHYNTGAIHRATLTKKHIAGDFEGAAAEFARWNKAGGRVLKGLVRRRAEEAKLYVSG